MNRRKFAVAGGRLLLSLGLLTQLGGPITSSRRKDVVVGVGGAGVNILNKLPNNSIGNRIYIDADDRKYGSLPVGWLKIPMENASWEERSTKVHSSAESLSSEIRKLLVGCDHVIIIAGLGGATGTSVSPIVARIAYEIGARVIGLWVHPFSFEHNRAERAARFAKYLHDSTNLSIDFSMDEDDFAADNSTMSHVFGRCDFAVTDTILKLYHA